MLKMIFWIYWINLNILLEFHLFLITLFSVATRKLRTTDVVCNILLMNNIGLGYKLYEGRGHAGLAHLASPVPCTLHGIS